MADGADDSSGHSYPSCTVARSCTSYRRASGTCLPLRTVQSRRNNQSRGRCLHVMHERRLVHVDRSVIPSGQRAHLGTVGPENDGRYTVCTTVGWVHVDQPVCADFPGWFTCTATPRLEKALGFDFGASRPWNGSAGPLHGPAGIQAASSTLDLPRAARRQSAQKAIALRQKENERAGNDSVLLIRVGLLGRGTRGPL